MRAAGENGPIFQTRGRPSSTSRYIKPARNLDKVLCIGGSHVFVPIAFSGSGLQPVKNVDGMAVTGTD
jgi:hypothetical protein